MNSLPISAPSQLSIQSRKPKAFPQQNGFPGCSTVRRGALQRNIGRSHVMSHAFCSRRFPTVLMASSAGTVRIIIQGRNLELTEPIRDYTDTKISKAVEHYEQTVKEVDVNLSVRGGDTGTKGDRQHKIEVTVHTLRNGTVRAESVAENMYASIDLVCDKVQRQLRKVKGKAIGKGKWPGRGGEKGGPRVSEAMDPATVGEIDLTKVPKLPQVVRTKYHYLKAFNEQEAIEELEKLDHDFYIYKDTKDGDIRVVYKRRERGYGVIIPVDE